jgi:hypothetical protein
VKPLINSRPETWFSAATRSNQEENNSTFIGLGTSGNWAGGVSVSHTVDALRLRRSAIETRD